MVGELNPNVKAYYAYKAINYLGGESEEKFSIAGSAKSAVGSVPIGIAFTQIPTAISYRKELGGVSKLGVFKEYAQIGKNLKSLGQTRPASVGEFFKSIFTKKGLSNSLDSFTKTEDVIKKTDDTIKAAKTAKATAKAAQKEGISIAEFQIKMAKETGGKTGIVGKFFGTIKKPFSAIAQRVGSIQVGGKALNQTPFAKLCKKSNAGFMAAIDGIIETFTQVVPAFKNGGFSEGVKQIGKSGVKVAASTTGFVLGETAGKAIGAAIGTAIFPGVGTAVGGILGGLIGGIFGSSVVGGIAKKIVGKSYTEKAGEEQKQTAAQQIAQDPATMQQLQMETLQRLSIKQQSGNALSSDERELLEYLNTNAYSSPAYGTNSSFNTVV